MNGFSLKFMPFEGSENTEKYRNELASASRRMPNRKFADFCPFSVWSCWSYNNSIYAEAMFVRTLVFPLYQCRFSLSLLYLILLATIFQVFTIKIPSIFVELLNCAILLNTHNKQRMRRRREKTALQKTCSNVCLRMCRCPMRICMTLQILSWSVF